MCQAADTALAGKFANSLKYAFALIAIERAHALRFDLRKMIEVLLQKDEDGCFLDRYLAELDAAELMTFSLKLLNVSKTTRSLEIDKAVQECIRRSSDSAPEDVRDELVSLLEVFALDAALNRGEVISVDHTLAEWQSRKHLWLFAWALDILIQSGHTDDKVREACAQALNRDPADDYFNSYFLLALVLAESASSSQDERTIGSEYLKRSIARWERSSSADLNMRVYMMLWKLDPDRKDHYLSQVLKWQAVHLHREHLSRLPELVKTGQFFLIFRDHFSWMQFWGLQSDTSFEDVSASLNRTAQGKQEVLSAWESNGKAIPNPLIKGTRGYVVGSEFVVLGSILFSPIASPRQYDEDRSRFNEMAERNLQGLLNQIVGLPRLPNSIRELLLSYSARLYSFAVPPDRAIAKRAG